MPGVERVEVHECQNDVRVPHAFPHLDDCETLVWEQGDEEVANAEWVGTYSGNGFSGLVIRLLIVEHQCDEGCLPDLCCRKLLCYSHSTRWRAGTRRLADGD